MRIANRSAALLVVYLSLCLFTLPRAARAHAVAGAPGCPAITGGRDVVVRSGDLEGLYCAIGDPRNANKRVLLQPGTYTLTPNAPDGTARPRGGSLFLQNGMELIGGNVYADDDGDGVWDATLDGEPVIAGRTFIDGTNVAPFADLDENGNPDTNCAGVDFNYNQYGTIIVLAYRNNNRISRVSVLGPAYGLSIGQPNSSFLPKTGMNLEVSDTFLDNGTITVPNMAFVNSGCSMSNASSHLLFERNIVRGGGEGIAILNDLASPKSTRSGGASVHAVVNQNHFIGNYLNLHSRNTEGTDQGYLNVFSTGNLFEDGAYGIEACAGTDLGLENGAIGDQYDLVSAGDTFRGNKLDILATGTWRYNLSATASAHNELRVAILGDTFVDGDALHAWPVFFAPRPGVDVGNKVTVLVLGSKLGNGSGTKPQFYFVDTVPGDSNVAQLVGSDAEFRRANGEAPVHEQYLAPPDPIDLANTNLHFTPSADGYQLSLGQLALDTNFGAALDYGDNLDDNTVELCTATSFPFLGNRYAGATDGTSSCPGSPSLWVNVDGNITFGAGDGLSTDRNIARLVSSQLPRMAPLLDDLDLYANPPATAAIYAKSGSTGTVITWFHALSWVTGNIDSNTFQVVLHTCDAAGKASGALCDDSFDFVYAELGTPAAVVGFSPGNLAQAPAGSDLSSGHAAGRTVYESFFLELGP